MNELLCAAVLVCASDGRQYAFEIGQTNFQRENLSIMALSSVIHNVDFHMTIVMSSVNNFREFFMHAMYNRTLRKDFSLTQFSSLDSAGMSVSKARSFGKSSTMS